MRITCRDKILVRLYTNTYLFPFYQNIFVRFKFNKFTNKNTKEKINLELSWEKNFL
jgi:hypothetical protein